MRQNLKKLKTQDKKVHIHWILSYSFISENELADKAVNKEVRNINTETINSAQK